MAEFCLYFISIAIVEVESVLDLAFHLFSVLTYMRVAYALNFEGEAYLIRKCHRRKIFLKVKILVTPEYTYFKIISEYLLERSRLWLDFTFSPKILITFLSFFNF